MKSRLIIIFCFLSLNVCSQTLDYKEEFNRILKADYSVGYSNKRISSKAKRNNSHHFLEIGYFINANNILGNREVNFNIIQDLIHNAPKDQDQYKWIVTDISSTDRNSAQKGKEFMLFEGYMFRYIAEFQYLYPEMQLSDPKFVKNVFFKWYNESVKKHRDASSLFGLRSHMGSHWATVASYLTKLDPQNNKLYKSFIDTYDEQLRKSLKIVNVDGKECYVWNSTYTDKFVNNLKKRNYEASMQDVSHGNHIVQYVLDSYNLGFDTWTRADLERFSNTLKYIIWKDKSKPSDYVDGTSFDSAKTTTGWKQSDGWMKLMITLEDDELYDIYDDFYKDNSKVVNVFYPNIQYFALMAKYQNNTR